ncbi:PIN domain-containing protein [Brevibacillus centrosporus]|uniref:PIN domain-containing protein n=1 Tax=Brevibacillus centrosporus TaxID=54910 RepID=UPI002E1BD1D9|nr:PIN domain-containing protein [Brevibacillus centrosporus]
MKKNFEMYYRPSEEEFVKLWEECIFVFDTNVLLNLYRYTSQTQQEFLNIVEKVRHRVWIPHQVALEYNVNRRSVILEQKVTYDRIRSTISKSSEVALQEMDNNFKKYNKLHPVLSLSSINERVKKFFSELNDEINILEEDHLDLLQADHVENH